MENRLPLQGIRVVDFTHVASGPMATKALADFGADVIKIESRKRPDLIRHTGPFRNDQPGPNRGGMYNSWNTSKLSLTLDLSHPKSLLLVRKLISISDVIINNFSARVMRKWGLVHEELVKIKPDIISVGLPSHGMKGPHQEYVSFGAELMALSGMAHATGYPEGPPTGPVVNYPDYIVCSLAAAAILSALRHRNRTGKGQCIEIPQFESTVAYIGPIMMNFLVNQQIPARKGNRSSFAVPNGTYRCRGVERWCAISIVSEAQWQNFCSSMGTPGLARDPRFQTLSDRQKNISSLDRIIEQWTSERTAEEVMHILQREGIPAGIVQNAQDLLQDPHLSVRGHYVELPHPEEGKMLYQNPPIALSRTPGRVKRSPL